MEGLGLLLLLWVLSAVFDRLRGGKQELPPDHDDSVPQAPKRRPRRPPRQVARPSRQPRPPEPGPAERAEEEWRKELERLFGLPGERGPVGRRGAASLPSAEEVEELDSLEAEPVVVSMDDLVPERGLGPVLDHDTGAEALVRRRIAAAESRQGALTRADHARFDARIRAEPERRPPAAPGLTTATLRRAFVWREILGPPVALRRPE